jgi:hypothetical protein
MNELRVRIVDQLMNNSWKIKHLMKVLHVYGLRMSDYLTREGESKRDEQEGDHDG